MALRTVKEVAQSYGITASVVRHWIQRGLPVHERKEVQLSSGRRMCSILDTQVVDVWVATHGDVRRMVAGGACARPKPKRGAPAHAAEGTPRVAHNASDGHEAASVASPKADDVQTQMRSLIAVLTITHNEYVAQMRDSEQRALAAGTMRRYIEAQEALRKLQLDAPRIMRQRGEVIDVAEHRIIIQETHAKVAAELRALPKKLAQAIAGQRDVRKVYAVLTREVEACMRHTAQVLEQWEQQYQVGAK